MRGSAIRTAIKPAAPRCRVVERYSWRRRVGINGHALLALFLALMFVATLAPSSFAMPAPGDRGPTDPAVSENTGSANFKIPIQVPPGPGGLAPSFALSYSSRRGDGPYGVGWDLDLGEIACSVRFGVPNYAYDSCGRFELNGQLLTKDGATNSYHSFVETFQQIEYLPASQSWQVINPNGTILRYGVDPDARIMSGFDIARWFLSEIQDPFGNSIFITYDTTDPGTRIPLRITYGAGATKAFGKRQIEFIFGENRPDPLHDYAGGIERKLTKRLTDIMVSSYGGLVRRYAFGYSLPGVIYTTNRSRLSWVQEFGSDCVGAISDCTGLPRQEYEYTDPSDSGTTERFSKFDVNENYVIPFSGNGHLGVPPVRIGDINGDGLPDLIKGGFYIGGFAEATVEINTGTGFALDPMWTAALRNLQFERPRAEFTQIKAVTSSEIVTSVYNVGIFEATFSTTTRELTNPLSETLMANPSRPFANASFGAKTTALPGVAVPGWIEAVGRMYFTDLDGDGFAEIIVSVRLSGVDKVLDSQGNAITPVRIPGRTVSMVYRNTGSSWVADSSLAEGLPPFGEVIFESLYGVDLRDPWDEDFFWNGENGLPSIDTTTQHDSCGSRGLRGWQRSSGGVEYGDDVCIDLVNLDPIFTDFNGDGFADLMVLELDDPESLYRGPEVYRGINATAHPSNFGKSRAWVQVPNAGSGQPRWIRATQYDLPSVDFGAGPWGLSQLNPFAHSGLGRTTGNYIGVSESSTATCSTLDPLGFAACAPTSYNKDNGVRLIDLNRDGLTDVIWSLYEGPSTETGFPLVTQGVLLNTGSGWCASTLEMAAHVGSQCAHAAMYYPPVSSQFDPNLPMGPNGFAFHVNQPPPGIPTGYLADFNSDGWIDFLQLQLPTAAFAASAAWLYNPAGASLDPPNVWVRDARYDINVAFGALAAASTLDGVNFTFLDVNGDGAADVVGDVLREGDLSNPGTVIEHPQAFISNSKHSDLLKIVRNGRGGEISISYESAIVQRDATPGGLEDEAEEHSVAVGEALNETTIADVIRWTSAPVVSEVKIAGPNRKPGPGETVFGPPTTYRYAQPRFCAKNQSDLGFRVVEKTRPGGEVVTSKFYQVHGRAGKTSSVVVSDNGVGHVYEEYWETQEQSALLPQPAGRPLIPATQPGSIDDPEVYVGRLAQVRWYNIYGAGSPPSGGQTVRTLHYDDSYGYNFANKIIEKRPTSILTTLRMPGSDAQNSIFGLPIEEKLFDWEMAGFAIASQDFLKHTLIDYQLGRPSSLIEMVKGRDDTGTGTVESHSMSYDSYGNLSQEIVHASSPSDDRVTRFCYDGDRLEGIAWCPDFGQDSHSVRVGVMDATGDGINAAVGVTSFEPDAGTGAIVGTRSTYSDEPSLSVDLDSFGRPVESFVSGGDQLWMRTSKMVYGDVPFQPAVVTRFDYPADGAADVDAIWSSVVSDGFGGTWKEIGKTPSGFVGTFTYHDPFLRTVRKSLPAACVDASCAAQNGASEPLAMRMEFDAIGRPIRDDTPHGFSIFEYSSTTKTGGPGAIGGAFDSVLEKNGKGDVIQRAMDGDRIAWVDECADSVAADATTIGSCSGPATTHTYYDYESTGEVRTIYDARAAASSFNDPNHYLQYHYDTLGRVVQIDDPALAGIAGHTLTTYDVFGNIERITNARGQPRVHAYDELNRLTAIETPLGETDYTVSYRPNEKQSGTDFSNDYSRTMTYDELGRIQQEQMAVRNAAGSFVNFYTDYTYDLVGRVTEVVHPAQHYDPETAGWQNTIVRYEYDGAFLDNICDLGSAANCTTAETQYVSSVGFDSLGRRSSITFPSGTRTFSYNTEHRLYDDSFVSPTYQYTRNYTGYDGIGNILTITGSETATQALDMNETYVYDQRNRIQQWTKEGTAHVFGYDDLGNLTLHAGETQAYDDLERPHAIKSRMTPTATISYSYDEDGNVESILGGSSPQYFRFDSANRIVCLGATSTGCDTRVAYDVSGKRIAEYPEGGQDYKAYIGDTFLFEHILVADLASVEVMLDGKRVALKRFRPQLRGASTAGLFIFSIPPPWIAGGLGSLGLLFIFWSLRNGTLVLVQLRPLRAATALTAASSLLLPYIAMAGVPTGGNPPSYYWEISDPLGTGMVMFDIDGERVRHQVFTPFGRIHAEVGADFRTFYAGHRRDDDSGMFYMQARWYDPGSGRFLSVDPVIRTILVPQSANAYSYAENNPTNGVDPSGMNVLGWPGPSGRPGIFQMHGLGWVNTTTTTTTTTNTDTGESTTTIEVTHEGSVAGGSAGLSQSTTNAIGNGGGSGSQSGTGSNVGESQGGAQLSDSPYEGVEEIVVQGKAPHLGLYETLLGRGLGSTLGRVADGAKEFFIGLALIAGGVFSAAGFLLVSPVVAPLIGRRKFIGLFGASLQSAETGVSLLSTGLKRSGSGLTAGFLTPLPDDPAIAARRF